jgi:hypothetical protein
MLGTQIDLIICTVHGMSTGSVRAPIARACHSRWHHCAGRLFAAQTGAPAAVFLVFRYRARGRVYVAMRMSHAIGLGDLYPAPARAGDIGLGREGRVRPGHATILC